MNTILPTSYFPTISYIRAILESENVIIEQYENFTKKTLRNRCEIFAANGSINLSVPTVKSNKTKQLIKDTRIDYSTKWQKQHFKSIESAYNSSPFYEYLIDDFLMFFEKEYKFLLDFNMQILKKILDFLDIKVNLKLSKFYMDETGTSRDFRYLVHQKTNDNCKNGIIFEPYYQVFADKHGFKSDLSVIDLIFNLGNESYGYLVASRKLR